MGIDYKMTIGVGVKLPITVNREEKSIPVYSETTGQKLPDKKITIKTFKFGPFNPIPFQWGMMLDEETEKLLNGFACHFEGLDVIVYKELTEADWQRSGNPLHLEIPSVPFETIESVEGKLHELGIGGEVKVYSILEVSC